MSSPMTKILFLLAFMAIYDIKSLSAAPVKYSGDWLAQELGMDTEESAAEALQLRNLSHMKSADVNAAEVEGANDEDEDEELQEKRKNYLELANQGKFESALTEIDTQIRNEESELAQDASLTADHLAHLLHDRVSALKTLNRHIEALVEAQKLKELLLKLRKPVAYVNNLIRMSELNLDMLNDYHKLQLTSAATPSEVKKAYRALMLLLHPDKNRALSEESRAHIKHLYDKVREAYERITNGN